tara:strand:+ start:241 stop:525 length:285 start_codon:yes stop_codon:yes gene_type:complete
MNLENITNVNDLLEANEAPSQADAIMKEVLNAGVVVGHEVCTRLVEANISLHKKNLLENLQSDKVDGVEVMMWTMDLERLEQALALLQKVDVGS